MKTLSELVKLRRALITQSDPSRIIDEVTSLSNNLLGLNTQPINELAEYITRNISNTTTLAKLKVDCIVEEIDTHIQAYEEHLLSKTSTDFLVDIETDRAHRQLTIPDDVREMLVGRIRLYSDWHYPGLEIGPRDGQFTAQLVGLDPLYVVDTRIENIEGALSQFPKEYQNRVRKYLVDYSIPGKTLLQLPIDQFGFVFSWNLFNYIPFNDVKKYMADVFRLLKPGGTFLFGYNDASTSVGVSQIEWNNMSYMTKEMVETEAKKLRYEITNSYGVDVKSKNLSWIEVKRPGSLTTIKAHQTLGIIKDFEQKKS